MVYAHKKAHKKQALVTHGFDDCKNEQDRVGIALQAFSQPPQKTRHFTALKAT